MRVFISHKQEDEQFALVVAERLKANRVEFYLDTFDPTASGHGDALGEHLRRILGVCSHLIAVISQRTKESWWVPWEIGIGTEKDYPISTYAGGDCELPAYLKKWPYLRWPQEVDVWVQASKQAEQIAEQSRRSYEPAAETQARQAQQFYQAVRRALGQ